MPSSPSQSETWQLSGLNIKTQQQGVKLKLESVDLPGDYQLQNIDYYCPNELHIYPHHQCERATLSFNYNKQNYRTVLDSQFDFRNNAWQVGLDSTNKQLQIHANANSRSIELKLNELILKDFVGQYSQDTDVTTMPEIKLSGDFALGTDDLVFQSSSPVKFSGLTYEYSDDVIIAELQGDVSFVLDINQQVLQYDVHIGGGEMLLNELYVDFSAYPLTANGEVIWQSNGWYTVSASLKNKQSLNLEAQFEFDDSLSWRKLSFMAHVVDAFHFNQNILGGILGIYGFGGTEMSGQFTLSVQSVANTLDQWSIEFDDYYFLNERRKITAESLSGILNWNEQIRAENSQLHWQALELAGLPINKSTALFNLTADEFNLEGEHSFPVFDGAIDISQWQMSALFSESLDMSLNADISPISLRLITEKMGWPLMAGKISGNIPGMVKKDQVIEFLGALNLDVFEGSMLVDNLSMERLFGVAPVIAADVKFEGFDLSLLTETFGFGLITGKLHGVIDGLRITNWKTDRLDAEVYTVKTKGIKQTISQRAIDNISSLGGIQGAISKTFLRFFDDFRYSNIKLSCKLHNSVCEIGGIKNTSNQFTIVEGGGIPNINIVGYVRSINWDEFISRLLNANYEG